jgi:two-component system, NtrC family, response regulator AtoC
MSGGESFRRRDRDGWEESTWAGEPSAPGREPEERQLYLLVIESDSSHVFPLPQAGHVVVGRGADVDLRLRDNTVSRRHARISITSSDVEISDLDSHNGTFVNGDRITGACTLASGDTITIHETTLVFHAGVRRASRAVLHLADLRDRADGEIERSLRYHRPLTFLAIAMRQGVDRPRVTAALARAVRAMDVVAWSTASEAIVLLPEHDGGVAHLQQAVLAVAPGAAFGTARCPADGCDVDTLINAARAAAHLAAPGAIASAANAHRTLTVGAKTIVIADAAMERIFALIARLAAADLPVLICGETGTGKELAASAVHYGSSRASRPLVAVNCAALPENLVESELFGHEKGAFTGAAGAKVGLLETASGGTIFLDEIGELPLAVQAKLLRVLETKRTMRVGAVSEREIDIRIVAATNRDLDEEVKARRFRQDLLFRLNSATLWLPPLRDRKRDLPLLAQGFLHDACARTGRSPMTIAPEAMQRLATYPWPGNVRELKNVMEFVAAAHAEDVVLPWHLAERLGADGAEPERPEPEPEAEAPSAAPVAAQFRPIEVEIRELERARMSAALGAAGGNQTRAAELISMPLRTFQAKVKAYGLRRSGDKK